GLLSASGHGRNDKPGNATAGGFEAQTASKLTAGGSLAGKLSSRASSSRSSRCLSLTSSTSERSVELIVARPTLRQLCGIDDANKCSYPSAVPLFVEVADDGNRHHRISARRYVRVRVHTRPGSLISFVVTESGGWR